MRAFIFPGQGSQAVGMGQALVAGSASARQVFEEVDEALGQKLSTLMAEGPLDELTLTANAQPAIMANAIATLRASGVDLSSKADFVAGHSLGEYTALCAAGSFDLATTARLLKLRGTAMQEAVPVGERDIGAQQIADAAADGQVCVVANDNDPSQVVISGHRAAVERALGLAKEKGAKRAVLLPVSAPFHCPLMRPAADRMEQALADADLSAPAVPLYANVTAAPVSGPDEIRRLLVTQVTGAVRWRESVLAMSAAGVTHFVEWGAKVLGPMVKRIAPEATVTSVVTADDIDALVAAL